MRKAVIGKIRTKNGESVELKQIVCEAKSSGSYDKELEKLVNFQGKDYEADSIYMSCEETGYYKSWQVGNYRKINIVGLLSAALDYCFDMKIK